MNRSNKQGFTLIELMIALAIVAVLATIAVVGYQSYIARAKAADIVLQYDAVRTGTLSQVATSEALVKECDILLNALNKTYPLHSQQARLGFALESAQNGYRPVLAVCAKADSADRSAVGVAREAYRLMTRDNLVIEQGAVVTDSLVSFALRLTPQDTPLCTAPASSTTPVCDLSLAAAKPASTEVKAAVVTAPVQSTAPPKAAQQCRLVTVGAPSSVQSMHSDLADLGVGYTPRAAGLPPSKPLPAGDAVGSSCLLCGDRSSGYPCSDLDLVLAITSACPDSTPICAALATTNSNGEPAEYRYCTDRAGAERDARQAKGCAADSYALDGSPDAFCSYACYGDDCNLIDLGQSLAGATQLVCD